MNITAFIFSKDRAQQLRLLLKSFQINCFGLFEPYILSKSSNNDYTKGYKKLQNEIGINIKIGQCCHWVNEVLPLRDEFIRALKHAERRKQPFCIFTDDCIFYRKCEVSASEINELFNNKIFCFSFRLGLNTIVQDYSIGSLQPPLKNYSHTFLKDHIEKTIITWRWKDYRDIMNYGYPVAMDGCCYLPEDLLQITENFQFDNFRAWEGSNSGPPRRDKIKKEYMASFEQSCVVNNPTNSMQDPPLASGRFYKTDPGELNRLYLEDSVIDIDAFNFSNVQGCHQEFPLKFKKEK